MADNFQVNIGMSASTVKSLQDGNFQLYAFKAVQSSQGGGAPLVWFKSNNFAPTVSIDWKTQFQAYVSSQSIIPNGTITASNSVDIDLDQVWQVDETGSGPVVGGGTNRAISILNEATRQWTTGIAEVVNGESSAMCAFPLYGKQLDVIAPITKVLLMFATDQVNTGTVIFKAFSTSLMVDLTADNVRNVGFDINTGWSWGGFSWGTEYPPNADLVPLLIESPTSVPEPAFKRNALVL